MVAVAGLGFTRHGIPAVFRDVGQAPGVVEWLNSGEAGAAKGRRGDTHYYCILQAVFDMPVDHALDVGAVATAAVRKPVLGVLKLTMLCARRLGFVRPPPRLPLPPANPAMTDELWDAWWKWRVGECPALAQLLMGGVGRRRRHSRSRRTRRRRRRSRSTRRA